MKDFAHDTDQRDIARACHRIVRAMHDGHCPNCGHLGTAESFAPIIGGHRCPVCQFRTTEEDEREALKQFAPLLRQSLDVFLQWRQERVRAKTDWRSDWPSQQ